jgi:hypothetical protein
MGRAAGKGEKNVDELLQQTRIEGTGAVGRRFVGEVRSGAGRDGGSHPSFSRANREDEDATQPRQPHMSWLRGEQGPSRQMQDIWETVGLQRLPTKNLSTQKHDASKVPNFCLCGAPDFAESRPKSIPRKGPFSTGHSLQMRPSGPDLGLRPTTRMCGLAPRVATLASASRCIN